MAGAKRTLAAAGLGTAALALAGCGGGSGGGGGGSAAPATSGTTTQAAPATTTRKAATTTAPSGKPLAKGPYVRQMKSIGRSLSGSLNKLSSAATPAKAATALEQVQVDLHAAAARLAKITPPAAVSAEHAKLVDAVRDFADELGPVIAKLKAGKMQALQKVPTLKGLVEIQNASTAITSKGYKIAG